MKKVLASLIFALILVSLPLSLVGCGKSSGDGKAAYPEILTREYLIGEWVFDDFIAKNGAQRPSDEKRERYLQEKYVFFENGTVKHSDRKGDYYFDSFEIVEGYQVVLHSSDPDHYLEYSDGRLLTNYDTNIYIAFKKK